MPETNRNDAVAFTERALDIINNNPNSSANLLNTLSGGYPEKPIYDDNMEFSDEVIEAMYWFKKNCKYSEGSENRRQGMNILINALATAYNLSPPELKFVDSGEEHSFASNYSPSHKRITMWGKLSLITLLHEFGHFMGMDENDAVEWSVSLFKRVYPKAYERLTPQGHCLVQGGVDNG